MADPQAPSITMDARLDKLSPTAIKVLRVLEGYKGFQGVTEERVVKDTATPKNIVVRALRDLASMGMIEARHYPNAESMYSIKSGVKIQDEPSQQWVKCPICGQEFSDAIAMNIHKTKKHPEVDETIAEGAKNTPESDTTDCPTSHETGLVPLARAFMDFAEASTREGVNIENLTLSNVDSKGQDYELTINRGSRLGISLEEWQEILIGLEVQMDTLPDMAKEDPGEGFEYRAVIVEKAFSKVRNRIRKMKGE